MHWQSGARHALLKARTENKRLRMKDTLQYFVNLHRRLGTIGLILPFA